VNLVSVNTEQVQFLLTFLQVFLRSFCNLHLLQARTIEKPQPWKYTKRVSAQNKLALAIVFKLSKAWEMEISTDTSVQQVVLMQKLKISDI
jgi:hypothetical protein